MSRSIDALVEQQGRRWELTQRRAVRPTPPPSIALSRQPFSGAEELGRRVAEKLDFGYFDIEIVEAIAREAGIRTELVSQLDEHVRGVIDRYVADAFSAGAFTESAYSRRLVHVLATLGEGGRAVLLGRGAVYVLEPKRTLRVLVTCPRELRLERLSREQGVAGAEAEARLTREDEQRREFIGLHFRADPDDASTYDLVVNTGTLGLDGAASLVVDALQHKQGVMGLARR